MYDLEPEEESWRLFAPCRGVDDLDFSRKDKWLTFICKSSCPVIGYCARSALKARENYNEQGTSTEMMVGVWGGEIITLHDYYDHSHLTDKNYQYRDAVKKRRWAKLEELAQQRPLLETEKEAS
ncbi:hypothetical protein PBI_KAMPE_52 [Gordonia phage Kampe]|uniref:Uncharacterized protein n=3 Tax=Gordonia phage Orchid TaxID=1838075 RepID=A0A166YGG0_9CAUD|nr:hypothetical protein BH761_gp051 [Gordonia phage Orchid]ANA87286.1 hypothetical protein PBI_PATRICKSTAR_52 [Gordonia phage PatrickStar]ANA87398.1 hypothetical protein PBI_ORCHID_51 [Gordonia phage Orchid]ANA87513.1 hypothetical protein PBI_KAMPE_52 [Gordonia phage Kampe]AXH46503.1 WhiB family transcription factor [Gordonia phage RobinSparkles]